MLKTKVYINYIHTSIKSVDNEGNEIESYKSIPAWVCKNLILYGNCFVSENSFKKIGLDILKEYDPKIQVRELANGRVLKHGL